MSRLPIRVRLTLAFALVMAVVFAAVGTILYVRLGDTLDERIADGLEARTTELASTFDVTSTVVAGEEGVAQVLERDGAVVSASGTSAAESLLNGDELRLSSRVGDSRRGSSRAGVMRGACRRGVRSG